MAQHQSQCSIFANQQRKVSNIFLCSCCFRPTVAPLPDFRSVTDQRSSTPLQIAFTEQSFQPFSGNFATIVRYPKPSFCNVDRSELYLCTIFTHNQSYRPNCDFDLKYRRIYYSAMLHVNIKIMMSQQRWYLLLSYFNNKI